MTEKEFNIIKEDVNLKSLKLMEELDIELAGANTDVRITDAKSSKKVKE